MSELAEELSICADMVARKFEGAPKKRECDAIFYLAHVECEAPLRRIAHETGAPVSSVHRAVRRVEALRDDPLLDTAFDRLAAALRAARDGQPPLNEDEPLSNSQPALRPAPRDASPARYVNRVARRALERLAEPDSFLMVARGAEKAGVFCRKNKFRRPLALVTREMAADFATRDWVRAVSRTEVSSKYVLSDAGRAWLKRIALEEEAQRAPVIGEQPSVYAAQHGVRGVRQLARADGTIETIRVNAGESPLGWLARRKGPDGAPFLAPEEVEAGEKLREDFEMAQIGPRVAQDWRNFLTPREAARPGRGPSEGPMFARERVSKALSELGPGLADVALRACCFLEGLEATERRMGWSARSGKVVLKLALQRLAFHYGIAAQPESQPPLQ